MNSIQRELADRPKNAKVANDIVGTVLGGGALVWLLFIILGG